MSIISYHIIIEDWSFSYKAKYARLRTLMIPFGSPIIPTSKRRPAAFPQGSALPVLARGVTAVATCFASSTTPQRILHSAPIRVGPVADVMCPSAHFKDQSGGRDGARPSRRPAGHKPAGRKSALRIIPHFRAWHLARPRSEKCQCLQAM